MTETWLDTRTDMAKGFHEYGLNWTPQTISMFFDGKLLWQTKVDAGVNAPPISYEIDGVQYIAVAAGGNSIFGYTAGDNMMVYALPR